MMVPVCYYLQSGPEKIAQRLMHRHSATFAVESHSFHQSAQRWTGSKKNGHILNIVIECSLFGSW